MSKKKDVRVIVTVKNNLILLAMEDREIYSVAELCRQMGTSNLQGSMGRLVNMRMAARKKNGEWRFLALKLSIFLKRPPELLFSEDQQSSELETNRGYAEVGYEEIRQLTHRSDDPELLAQADELRTAITKTVSLLKPPYVTVLSMRFGLNGRGGKTLEEVGSCLGLTRERIRQIEAKGLKILRNPSYNRQITDAGGGGPGFQGEPADCKILDAL